MSPQTTDRVLVYHHRANGSPVVKKGIALITRAELDQILVNHPTLEHTTKPLDHLTRHIEIYAQDLLPSASNPPSSSGESEGRAMHGTERSNVAGVTLPLRVYVEGLVREMIQGRRGKGGEKNGGGGELVILKERVGAGGTKEGRADGTRV